MAPLIQYLQEIASHLIAPDLLPKPSLGITPRDDFRKTRSVPPKQAKSKELADSGVDVAECRVHGSAKGTDRPDDDRGNQGRQQTVFNGCGSAPSSSFMKRTNWLTIVSLLIGLKCCALRQPARNELS
jgi:hypothetical protein